MMVPAPQMIYLRAVPAASTSDETARQVAVAGTVVGVVALALGGLALLGQRGGVRRVLRIDQEDVDEIGTDPAQRRLIIKTSRGDLLSVAPELVEEMADSLFEVGIRQRPRVVDARVIDSDDQ